MNKIYTTYLKQSNLLNVGHVYEHIIYSKFEYNAFSQGMINGIDYNILGEVYKGIVHINIEYSDTMISDILLGAINSCNITVEDIKKAVNEISCEYKSPYECNFELLHNEINTLHKQPWTKQADLTITKPIIRSGWSLDNMPIIKFKKVVNKKYNVFSFTLNLKNIKFELKPLAMYLIQSISMAQISLFYNYTPELEACYGSGYDWAKWQFQYDTDLVGHCREITVFSNQNLSVKYMKKLFDKNLQNLISKNFTKKFQSFILNETQERYKYFNNNEMMKYSGAIIGNKWHEKYCTIKNIEILLDKIEITVDKEK